MQSQLILNKMLASKIIAVIRKVDPSKIHELVSSLVEGGISTIEITMDSKESSRIILELRQSFEKKATIGAGTVLNKKQAEEAITAGSEFIFSPILDKETITYVKSKNIIMIPGVFTPTEMQKAFEWGTEIVKVFPANVLGPSFFKDVRGPLGHIAKIPTGGIHLGNVQDFLKAGAVAVGVGSSLVNQTLIEQQNWTRIQQLAEQFVHVANHVTE